MALGNHENIQTIDRLSARRTGADRRRDLRGAAGLARQRAALAAGRQRAAGTTGRQYGEGGDQPAGPSAGGAVTGSRCAPGLDGSRRRRARRQPQPQAEADQPGGRHPRALRRSGVRHGAGRRRLRHARQPDRPRPEGPPVFPGRRRHRQEHLSGRRTLQQPGALLRGSCHRQRAPARRRGGADRIRPHRIGMGAGARACAGHRFRAASCFSPATSNFKYRQLRTVGGSPAIDEEAVPGQYPQGAETAIEFGVLERRGGAKSSTCRRRRGQRPSLSVAVADRSMAGPFIVCPILSASKSDQRDGTIIGAAISIIAVSGLFFLCDNARRR